METTVTLWQADYRGPKQTARWTGQQKASHGKRRIPAKTVAQEDHKKLRERWKINDVLENDKCKQITN